MLVFWGVDLRWIFVLKRRNEVYALRETESHRLLARGDDLIEVENWWENSASEIRGEVFLLKQ